MTENDINAKLSKTLTANLGPDYWFAKISDRATGGQPDFMLLGHGLYSGWEVKYNDGDFVLPPLQLLTCQRINRVAYCRFVVFHLREDVIDIVHPTQMFPDRTYRPEIAIQGFKYEELVQFMKEVHTR